MKINYNLHAVTANKEVVGKNYSGRRSAVVIKSSETYVIVPSISNYKITDSSNVVNWSVFGSVYKRKLPTTKDWSGSIDGKIDLGAEGVDGQLTLMKNSLQMNKTELYFFFELILTPEGAPDLTQSTFAYGNIYVNSFDFNVESEDVASVSATFEGDGDLTYQIKGTKIEYDPTKA